MLLPVSWAASHCTALHCTPAARRAAGQAALKVLKDWLAVQAELAEQLQVQGLRTTGLKADMLERLQQHLFPQSTNGLSPSQVGVWPMHVPCSGPAAKLLSLRSTWHRGSERQECVQADIKEPEQPHEAPEAVLEVEQEAEAAVDPETSHDLEAWTVVRLPMRWECSCALHQMHRSHTWAFRCTHTRPRGEQHSKLMQALPGKCTSLRKVRSMTKCCAHRDSTESSVRLWHIPQPC